MQKIKSAGGNRVELIDTRNRGCADAVCTVAMDYDPQADHAQFPFHGDNHLKLLASAGAGSIDPKRIEVRGLALDKAIFPFNPNHQEVKHPLSYYHLDCAWRHAMA